MRNAFSLSTDRSCGANMQVNLVNGIWQQFQQWWFSMPAFGQCERGISANKHGHFNSTSTQRLWPIYPSDRCGKDTVKFCPAMMRRYWHSKWIQRTFRSRWVEIFIFSLFFPPAALSETAIFLPSITAGTSFVRNECPQSVQKYRINCAQRWISRFLRSHLLTAILCTNWRELGKQN